MQLTEHFSLEELIASDVAARKGIDNRPPAGLLPNLRLLGQGLEQVRAQLGGLPIHVNSGYRSQALNAAVGGAAGSWHILGLAADIICPKFGSPLQVCRAIAESGLAVDQVIHEFGTWCHVSFPSPLHAGRRELWTIARSATGYEPGLRPVA